MSFAALLLLLLVAIVLGARALGARRARRDLRSALAEGEALQAYLVPRVEALRRLVAREDLDRAAKQIEADRLLDEVQARNRDGALDAFIQDNRDGVREALDRPDR